MFCETGRGELAGACISILFHRVNDRGYYHGGELHFDDSYDAARFVEILKQRDERYPPLNEAVERDRFFDRELPIRLVEVPAEE